MPEIDVHRAGPVFDGRIHRAISAYVDSAEERIAEEGLEILRGELHRVLRHPTGYYESRTRVERGHVITDGGVVYGPWLAGTGSRNAPVTRFAGYDHWTVTQARLDQQSRPIAERVLRRFIGRMQ